MRPTKEHATNIGQTYMITSSTWGRRAPFGKERWARLLIDTLDHYWGSAYLLHEFVVMPDHIHVLITPKTSLEKAVQFIKGGFSYRAKKELGSSMEVWQKGFSDHRIRDAEDCRRHFEYIRQNPVRKHLYRLAEEYLYSSAFPGFELDPIPHGLKPESLSEPVTARLEGVPFQSNTSHGAVEAAPLQNTKPYCADEDAPLQNTGPYNAAEAAPLQSDISGRAARAEPIQNDISNGVAEHTHFQSDPSNGVTNAAFSKKPSKAIETEAPPNKSGKIAS